jgi:pseudouridine-5'-phosphate glycosidase
LETEGVPVVTYNSDEFPAFYTTNSGIKTPFRLNTYADIARLIDKNAQLNLLNGILVCVPNPHPASS